MTTHPPATPRPARDDLDLRESALLVPGTALLHRDAGWLLQTADGGQHAVLLDAPDVASLIDALVTGTVPGTPLARRALAALVAAGHATSPGAARPAPRVRVVGSGALADEVTAALASMGAGAGDAATSHVHVLERAPVREDTPPGGLTCWVDGHQLVLAPRAVSAQDTAARRRAARRPAQPPRTDRSVVAARPVLPRRALVVAGAFTAAEALRRLETGPRAGGPDRDDHLATVLDLLTLHVTRHPVLPVPPPPA